MRHHKAVCASHSVWNPDSILQLVECSFRKEGQNMRTSRSAVIGVIAGALFSVSASAQESRLGTISRLDKANGTIAIADAQTGTTGSGAGAASQEFKVQDGLVFNAVKEGDRISYTVQDIRGVKTVTKLEKR